MHVSMNFEPFREGNAVNTGLSRPKVPIHRKLGLDRHSSKLPWVYLGAGQRCKVLARLFQTCKRADLIKTLLNLTGPKLALLEQGLV
jgi:hypothetical protein